MLNVNNLIGFGNQIKPKIEITNKYFASQINDVTDRTWSSVTVGAEFENRYIVVLIRGQNSVTINGVSASQLDGNIQMWGAFVPTGTSITITTSAAASTPRATIGVYTLNNVSTKTKFRNQFSTGVINPSVTETAEANSVILAYANNDETTAFSWVGLAEDYDQTIEATARYSYASSPFTDTQSITITAQNTTSSNLHVLVVYN